jgi:hypothetical protein
MNTRCWDTSTQMPLLDSSLGGPQELPEAQVGGTCLGSQ